MNQKKYQSMKQEIMQQTINLTFIFQKLSRHLQIFSKLSKMTQKFMKQSLSVRLPR